METGPFITVATTTSSSQPTTDSTQLRTSSENVNDTTIDPSEFVQPIHKHGMYDNPWDTWSELGLIDVIKWVGGSRLWNPVKRMSQKELDMTIPVLDVDKNTVMNPPADAVQSTWIGHASTLVQMEGVNFLTDPVFAERCSPLSFAGPKRIRKTPLRLEDLPPIDFVVISHDHYDHLDFDVVKRLGNASRWYVPKGLKKWFNDNNIENVVELNWWESHQYNDNITVVCTPCQHWSKRGALEKRKSLWGSWVVVGKQRRVFFSGDTGYCSVFKTIGKKYGPFDLSMIAIGAYCPRKFMKPQHIDPEEAVQIHEDLKSKFSVGIHWGTFILTDEPEDEPPKFLRSIMEKRGLAQETFIATAIGQTLVTPAENNIGKALTMNDLYVQSKDEDSHQ